jgi:hypothetical protein
VLCTDGRGLQAGLVQIKGTHQLRPWKRAGCVQAKMEVKLRREFLWNSEEPDNNSNNSRVMCHTAINVVVNDMFIVTLVVNTVWSVSDMANRGLLEQLDALQFEIYPIPVSPELLIAPGCPQQNTGRRCLFFFCCETYKSHYCMVRWVIYRLVRLLSTVVSISTTCFNIRQRSVLIW